MYEWFTITKLALRCLRRHLLLLLGKRWQRLRPAQSGASPEDNRAIMPVSVSDEACKAQHHVPARVLQQV